MRFFAFVMIFSSILVTFGEKARFDNYRVYLIHIDNADQLKVIQDLEANPDGLLFLEVPTTIHSIAELLVPPHKFAEISEIFKKHNLKNQVRTNNLQRFVL